MEDRRVCRVVIAHGRRNQVAARILERERGRGHGCRIERRVEGRPDVGRRRGRGGARRRIRRDDRREGAVVLSDRVDEVVAGVEALGGEEAGAGTVRL